MYWAENCVYEAFEQLMKHEKKPVDEIQKLLDELKYRVKNNQRKCYAHWN